MFQVMGHLFGSNFKGGSCQWFPGIQTIRGSTKRKDLMAKSHYSFKKRKKELERKEKQERKRQRKFNKSAEEDKDPVDNED